MEKVLTVSVAAYNVESCLKRALDSLVVPEHMDELEVLVINDGSTDATPVIAEAYCRRYPGTFRLINKANGGYGSTVNRSMREAKGKYFRLLDGDDYFDREGLIALLDALKASSADWVITPYTRVMEGSGERLAREHRWSVYIGQTLRMADVRGTAIFGMWALTVRTELLRAHPFRLPEHTLYTDQQFVMYSMPYVDRMTFLPGELYLYVVGRDGQSVSRESRIRHRDDAMASIRRILYFCGTRVPDDNPNRYLITQRAGSYLAYAFLTLMLDKPSLANYRESVRLLRYAGRYAPSVLHEAMRQNRKVYYLAKTHCAAYFLRAGKIENWS